LYLNCSASDTDGGTDISFSNVTSTNGTVLSVSNGTSGTSFWSTWNVTGLNQLTTINTTCIIKDSSNISVNQTSSFTTSSSDSYSNPVQVGSAPVNTLVLWNVTYTANGDPHNCSYTYVTSQVNSSASYVLDSLSQGVSSTLNPTNITWNCTSSSSPYAIYISSVAVTVNTSSVGGSTLGENAVIYQHTYNGTIPINFLFTSSYPSNAISRSLWRCTLDNISRCDAANSSQWIAQTYTETGSFTLSRTYSIVTSNLVLVTTYSTSIPGGGGGSGGIVGNLTSIFQFPASNETIAFAKATEETLVGAGKSLRYDVFGIEFYWYIIIICIGIFVNETRKTKTLLSPNKITGRQALSAVIALLLFTLYGVLGFLPKTPEDGKFTLDVGLSNIISSISNLIHGTILGVELNIWAGLVMILYAVSKIISRKVNIGVIAIFIAGTIVIALPSILKI
jgi:hypothetical protein